jgi:hypothetical protein
VCFSSLRKLGSSIDTVTVVKAGNKGAAVGFPADAECNSLKIKKMPFGVSTITELKNLRTTYDNTGTLVSRNTLCHVPVLSAAAVTFFSSIVVSTQNGQFLYCATSVGSERILPSADTHTGSAAMPASWLTCTYTAIPDSRAAGTLSQC